MRSWLLCALACFAVALAGCDEIASVLYPRNEEATRDNLSNMRDRINDWAAAHGGKSPEHATDAVATFPAAETGHHMRNDQIIEACTDGHDASQLKDSGGWAYCANPNDPNFGKLVVDCTHNDSAGKPWYSY